MADSAPAKGRPAVCGGRGAAWSVTVGSEGAPSGARARPDASLALPARARAARAQRGAAPPTPPRPPQRAARKLCAPAPWPPPRRVVNLAGRYDVSGGIERRLGAAVLRRLEEDGQVGGSGAERDVASLQLSSHRSLLWLVRPAARGVAVGCPRAVRRSCMHVVVCSGAALSTLRAPLSGTALVCDPSQVEMRGRSRARGEFTWLLTKDDVTDRLQTDVAAACAAIPAATRVLTIHGTGASPVRAWPVGCKGAVAL